MKPVFTQLFCNKEVFYVVEIWGSYLSQMIFWQMFYIKWICKW